jgi:Flp pilus assembly protein TadD
MHCWKTPTSRTCTRNLGDYLYRSQRYDEAFESLSRVVRLDMAHGADVYLKLGNIHYRRGAMDDARAAWERALEIEPANDIVRANLGALRRNSLASTPAVANDAAPVTAAA